MARSRIGADAEPVSVAPKLKPSSPGVAWAPREERVRLLRQMLATLESTTQGGRGYLMGKVLVLFRQEALDSDARFTAQQLAFISHSLCELEHEAKRISPETVAFRRGAQILVELFVVG